MLHRLVFLLKNLANALQNILNMIKLKTKIFGLKDEATKPLKREKAETINCHYPDVLWNSKIPSFCEIFTQDFPSFQPIFYFSTRMLIFRKQTRKQKFLSCLPLAKYLDFYDVSKNSEHINTFRGAPTQKSPSQTPKFNFLEQKESQRPEWKSFQTCSINGELKSFYPKAKGKKTIWS
jgi:hypothetical protein